MPERRNVLLVDDDRNIAKAVGIRLRAAGYDVHSTYAGPEGVAAATASRPDAIILDVRMPGMSGLDVLEVLQSRPETCNIPVVMLSASLLDEDQAIGRGAEYFLQKPFDPQKLCRAIERVLTQPRADA
ncbi:MAG TPA: response regulator [Phycisphaerae bacterium]|nr:response regulator [Phycisphaerales bacterium]HRX84162.1 response regulator [Phycisphaerae bacterium]